MPATITLSPESVKAVAREVARIMLQAQAPDLVDCNTAAEILHVTPNYLRRIKDRYPHVKRGEGRQARLLFDRNALLQ